MKQVILLRTDLKLGVGKAGAQIAHASLEAASKSKKDALEEWKAEGMKKVVLKVKDEAELLHYHRLAREQKLVTALITDAGRTVLKPGTKTCLAIGPDEDEKIDTVTGKLKVL